MFNHIVCMVYVRATYDRRTLCVMLKEWDKNFIYKQCQYIYDVWIQWMSMVKR